jgi:DNA-binding transcriptional LysR family regulator
MRNEDDMRLFVSIVKSGTLQGATSSSSLTRSGISKRLSRLEQRLGVRLLNRTTRSIALTSAGTAYYEASNRILDEIVAIEESVSASGRNLLGTLHVAAPSVLAEQILVPLLADFHAANPTVRIKLECAEGKAELVGQSVDLSVRIGKPDDAGSVSRKLLGGRLLHCGAASYLDAHPAPATPGDLTEHKCVLLSALGTDWNDWPFLQGKGTQTVRVRGPITCNSSNSHYTAVLNGLGIGPVVEAVARTDIEAGRLRPVLERYSAPDSGAVYAIYPSARQVPGKLRVFLEFLTRRLSPRAKAVA